MTIYEMRGSIDLGCWAIPGEDLMDLLRRVAAGENPDLVYAEAYANCEVHLVDEDDE